jgi:glycosyltransferase involved in cell wall biosynthesis
VDLIGLVESAGHVCARYRLDAFRPLLREAGHTLELRPLPRRWWDWLRLGKRLGPAGAVVLQRRLLPAWQLRLLRRAARVLVYDFDDAVFLRDSYSRRGLHSPRRLRRFAATVRAADLVVAGNAFLAGQAAAWTDPKKVCVIPTCVDPTGYPLAPHIGAGTGVELVWIGSASTLRGLEAVRPLLETVGRRLPGLRLKLVCDRFLELGHLAVVPCPWTQEGEAAALAAADIGISWVPDDVWSRGKCGLKVLQYMAAGLPVVANSVGVQAEMVRHGETGLVADTPGEWVAAVGTLARDPLLRRCMGRAGRRRVEAEYGVAAGAARWRALLDGSRLVRAA